MSIKHILAACAVISLCFGGVAFAAEKLNLNSATEKELAADPSIGADLAKKIVERREDIGDFQNYDELKDIDGIDEAKIKKITEHFEIVGVAAFDCNC